MAALLELADLSANTDLQRKLRVAVVLAAQAQLALSPGTVQGRKWALDVISDPKTWGYKVLLVVLAANAGLSSAQISGATDAAITNVVNGAVASMVAAFSGL